MASNDRYLRKLIELYLQAETDIINEIGRLRSLGLVDYHAVAALERVQKILRGLENECWTYVPRMIEAEFYAIHPEARKPLEYPETIAKHLAAYANARALTGEQHFIVDQLVNALMAEVTAANMTAMENVQRAIIGRVEPDIYRRVGLEVVALQEAKGGGVRQGVPDFVERLRREGITAFTDKAGRDWSLHTYGSMICRTTAHQAEVMAVLTRDTEHDLYTIKGVGDPCGLCAPYQNRVYSKSGENHDFPPLSDAFGKIDPAGGNTLLNTWLNIHPNCRCAVVPWTAAGRSAEEIERIKRFSDPRNNPYDLDPRSEKAIAAYRKREAGRRRWLANYRQWERYRETLSDKVPKTFETFNKHKRAGDEKYKTWEREYRAANRASRLTEHAEDRIAEREISQGAIDDALKNPLHVGKTVIDAHGRPSVKYIGKDATVCVNPNTNAITTTWKTGHKTRRKYENENPE